ncbi:hypothetical protein [Pseudomonas leptonychotis]|uniref:hypothetical protein n=1 Tax=Pseudomonas leptonychotis TaxID=2448482 RepID=UPI00386722AA
MNTEEMQQHHRHLINSLALLDKAAADWSPEDLARGEVTRRNLQREIGRVEGDLHLVGARLAKAR